MEITKELIYEQFAKLKTKDEKVKYLIDLKEDNRNHLMFSEISKSVSNNSTILLENGLVLFLLVQ